MVCPRTERVKRDNAAHSLVVVALGSNLGDRAQSLALGRSGLAERGFDWTLSSRVHETAAVGGPGGQRAYLNQVIAADASRMRLSPHALLAACLEIEEIAGRRRRERWGPRTLDLDIIFFGERVVTEGPLLLPHPAAASRSFVLEPLAEIAPGLVHPVLGVTVAQLAARCAVPGRPA